MVNLNALNDILDKIRNELTSKISLAKNMDKVDITTLSQYSKTLNDIILTSEIPKEDKVMLNKFSLTLQEGMTSKSLRYEKQDLERIISNLND
ncbi:hypothetical protein YTPLAS73_02050 [Nitrosarchaeum sp.]|nr:hypothetical protein YTPLAS73_02050 [Nitrosarchaeum sp.]